MAFWNPRASKSTRGDNWHTFQFSALQLLSWWPWQHWLAFWWWTSPGHQSNHCLSVIWRHQDVRDEEETTIGMFLSKVPNVLLTPQLFIISPLFSYLTWSFFFHTCWNRDSTAFCYLVPLCSVIHHGPFSSTLVQTDTSGSNVCHML